MSTHICVNLIIKCLSANKTDKFNSCLKVNLNDISISKVVVISLLWRDLSNEMVKQIYNYQSTSLVCYNYNLYLIDLSGSRLYVFNLYSPIYY